jgi:predicted ATPase with chaperone activity
MSTEQLYGVIEDTPVMPRTVAETGLPRGMLLGLVLKFMRLQSCETLPELSQRLHLSQAVIQEIIDDAVTQKLVHVLGSVSAGIVRYIRYALSDHGRDAAGEASEQTQYLGPAPVSLAAYQRQVNRQKITNEKLDVTKLRKAFAGMVLSDATIRKLVPAISAGRTVLLYGPPGNGKTSVGTRVASLFNDPVFIPYAVEVGGQIIKIFDPSLHKLYLEETPSTAATVSAGVQLESFDARWTACRRPIAMAGGEMTLDMLDLRWDPITKCYDAPLHMKALNGVFLIDDFGRQKVNPTDFLNRWIVPLESRIDYLKLNTGITFMLPFDELVIFSTNLEPRDLMDPAFLRRIPYKLQMLGPTLDEYREIFLKAAAMKNITISQAAFDYIVEQLTHENRFQLAAFQPFFLCDQVAIFCKCFDLKPEMTVELAADALENLYVGIVTERV